MVRETGAVSVVAVEVVDVEVETVSREIEPQPASREETMAATRGREKTFRISGLLEVRR
jgi:hypothetical protein